MTLKIEISNINSSEAVDFVAACRDVQNILNEKKFGKGKDDIQYDLIGIQFEFKDDPRPVFIGESTPFERYINSTKKE